MNSPADLDQRIRTLFPTKHPDAVILDGKMLNLLQEGSAEMLPKKTRPRSTQQKTGPQFILIAENDNLDAISQFVGRQDEKCLIFTTEDLISQLRTDRLTQQCRMKSFGKTRFCFHSAFSFLKNRSEFKEILCFVDSDTAWKLLKKGWFSQIVVLIRPKLLNDSEHPSTVEGGGAQSLLEAIQLKPPVISSLGNDLLAVYEC